MVVGGQSYRVPCNECQGMIVLILFSLHFFPLPGTCTSIYYGSTDEELCTYACMRVYVHCATRAGYLQLGGCNSPRHLRECISDGHRRRCEYMRVYVHSIKLHK